MSREIVSFHGLSGSYTETAAKELFGENVEYLSCESFERVFTNVHNDVSRYGVVPMENSSVGVINDVKTLFEKYSNLSIINNHSLDINHCLVGIPGCSITDIRVIVSHVQAIRQCDQLINKYDWICNEMNDTADSAKFVSKSCIKSLAAICSEKSAEIYGLCILKKGCQNFKNNSTRFVVFEKSIV